MTTEAALRTALKEIEANTYDPQAVHVARAALALPEAPREYRVAGSGKNQWAVPFSCLEHAQHCFDVVSGMGGDDDVTLESRTAAGPWTPHEVQR